MAGVTALGLGLVISVYVVDIQQVLIVAKHLFSFVSSLTAALGYSKSIVIYYSSIVLIMSDNMSNIELIIFLSSNALSNKFMPKRLERRLSALTLFLIMFFGYN